MRLTHTLLAAGAALALTAPAPAGAQVMVPEGGNAVVFGSPFGLAAGDVDRADDLYVRNGSSSLLVTDGTADAPLAHVLTSADGSVSLLYDADGGVVASTYQGLEQVTTEPGTDPLHIAVDGERAYLQSMSQLTPDDTDAHSDVYEYAVETGAITLKSTSTPDEAAWFAWASASGMVFFTTTQKIDPADTDAAADIYATGGGGTIFKISPGNAHNYASMNAMSTQTGRVVFSTAEKLVPADVDSKQDIYTSIGGAPTLVTPSPNPAAEADHAVFLKSRTTDAGRIVFKTAEQLVNGDQDAAVDVYAAEGGQIKLLTPSTTTVKVHDISDDAEMVLFSTPSQALVSDLDESEDMYRASDDGLVHLLKTNGPADQTHGHLSPDGSVAAFATAELAGDADDDGDKVDVFVETGGMTYFASGVGAGGVADKSKDAVPSGVLASGEVVFRTEERLLGADRHDGIDAYGFNPGQLSLISADTHAPETQMTTTGAGAFSSTLKSTEQGTFECRVDGGDWSPCGETWDAGPLPAGEHVLEARAVDVAGNADATPAQSTVTGTVEPATLAPETQQPQPGQEPQQQQQATQQQATQQQAGPDTVAPALSAAKAKVRRRVPALTFTLSEAASVRVIVERRAGRRFKRVRSLRLAGVAGANRARLARLPRRGTFRIVLVATDAAGNASPKLALRPKGR